MKSLGFTLVIVLWSLLLEKRSIADEAKFIIERESLLALQFQVEQQGFEQPQNYAIKIGSLLRRDAKTERTPTGIVTTIDQRIPLALLPTYTHHEYAHACQMQMGGPSQSLFMDEASATLQEILAIGPHGTWQKAVEEFQQHPQIAPFVDVSELDGRLKASSKFEYGGALFLLYLEQVFGQGDGKWVRELWMHARSDLRNMSNTKWVALIESKAQREMQDLVLEFSNWRLDFEFPKMLTVASDFDHAIFISPFDWPLALGCVLLRVPSSPYEMRFALSVSSDRALGFAWRKTRDATQIRESGVIKALTLGQNETLWNLEGNQSLVLSICDLGAETFLRRDWAPHPLKVTFAVR